MTDPDGLVAAVAAVSAGAAAALLLPPRPDLAGTGPGAAPGGEATASAAWGDGSAPVAAGGPVAGAAAGPRRTTVGVAVLGGLGAALVVGGASGWAVGAVVAVLLGRVAGRREPAGARRERDEAAAALPVLVDLLAAALAAGSPVDRAVAAVCEAWPGPAADRLTAARARLALGVDPVAVWEAVARDPALAPLGRALARAAGSGAPVAAAVTALADDLAQDARAGVEDRARTVGVRAALPLGLCLLPAFVLLGIVPLAAGLLAGLVR